MMVKEAKSDLERIRDAVAEVFGTHIGFVDVDEDDKVIIDKKLVRETVERWIVSGEDDPGGWSPNAVAVINCEGSNIPDGSYDDSGCILEKWFKVSAILGDLYCEHINSCVIGVYRS